MIARDDAADDVSAARAVPAHRRRAAGRAAGSSALVVAGFFARLVRVRRWSRTRPTRPCSGPRCASPGSLTHGWIVGAVVLAGAGAFQFSALKYRCLEQCHTPFVFVMSRWHGRAPRREAWRHRRRPRRLLRRLLLGADAGDVRRRHRQPRLDARARGGHGGREEPALGPPVAHAARASGLLGWAARGRRRERLGNSRGRAPVCCAGANARRRRSAGSRSESTATFGREAAHNPPHFRPGAPRAHEEPRMKFRFPIVIIDEDFRSENTSRPRHPRARAARSRRRAWRCWA